MKIEALELSWIRMPLVGRFATSRGGVSERNVLLVRVRADGLSGWGESAADREPGYSYETVVTCWHVIEDFVAPRLFSREWPEEDTGRVFAREFADWIWHPMARAAVEEALWDLEARRRQVPLARLYADDRPVRDRIPVGISLGIQEDFEVLARQVEEALATGYRRIKLKIEPGRDVEVVDRIRSRFGEVPLMVDANCGYRPEDIDDLLFLDAYGLAMIEQPFEHDRIDAHAELQRRLETPVCLDEAIKSPGHAARALDRGACRIVNIKCARMGGRAAGIAVHDLCEARGTPVWHGGMLETGIGRLHNVAMASLPNFTMPGDLSASRRYWDQDLIDPPVEVDDEGTVAVPTGPGLGHRVREGVIEDRLVRREILRP